MTKYYEVGCKILQAKEEPFEQTSEILAIIIYSFANKENNVFSTCLFRYLENTFCKWMIQKQQQNVFFFVIKL